jgi:hypothetical protein
MKRVVTTAFGKQQQTSHAKHSSGLERSPHLPEMHVMPLQHVYWEGHAAPICKTLCEYAAQFGQNKA